MICESADSIIGGPQIREQRVIHWIEFSKVVIFFIISARTYD
jgi:uncharacterized heparinase superfamily protein